MEKIILITILIIFFISRGYLEILTLSIAVSAFYYFKSNKSIYINKN